MKNQSTTIKNRSQKKPFLLNGIALICLMLFSVNTIQAQATTQVKEYTVNGIVSDENGPLPGVSIILQGTNIGTEADFNGNFKFPKSLKNGDVLVFSHIGMESQKVIIKGNDTSSTIELKIQMAISSNSLLGDVASKKVYKSKKN